MTGLTTSLVVQQVRLWAPNADFVSWSRNWIPHAVTKSLPA